MMISSLNLEIINLDNDLSKFDENIIDSNMNSYLKNKERLFNSLDRNKSKKISLKKKEMGANILIVDDNMFNILILENYIQRIDFCKTNLFKAFDGSSAFEIFVEKNQFFGLNNIDIIIMDTEMPIMNGYDASKLIKEKVKKENFIDCMIISYSSLQGEDALKQSIESGMSGHLLKPTSQQIFQRYIIDIFINIIFNEEG